MSGQVREPRLVELLDEAPLDHAGHVLGRRRRRCRSRSRRPGASPAAPRCWRRCRTWNFVTPYLALNASMLSGEMYSLQLYMNSSFSMSPAGGELSAAAALGAALGAPLGDGRRRWRRSMPPATSSAARRAGREEGAPPRSGPLRARKPRRLTLVSAIPSQRGRPDPRTCSEPPPPAVAGMSRTQATRTRFAASSQRTTTGSPGPMPWLVPVPVAFWRRTTSSPAMSVWTRYSV